MFNNIQAFPLKPNIHYTVQNVISDKYMTIPFRLFVFFITDNQVITDFSDLAVKGLPQKE